MATTQEILSEYVFHANHYTALCEMTEAMSLEDFITTFSQANWNSAKDRNYPGLAYNHVYNRLRAVGFNACTLIHQFESAPHMYEGLIRKYGHTRWLGYALPEPKKKHMLACVFIHKLFYAIQIGITVEELERSFGPGKAFTFEQTKKITSVWFLLRESEKVQFILKALSLWKARWCE